MSTIITRNSANSGSTPSSLVQGELAINVTDGRLFYGSGSGNVVKEFGVTASYAIDALSASYAETASYVNTLNQNVNITGTLKVHSGNVDITSNAYFFQGTNTSNGNVSLIGVNNQNQVYIGNQGYTNIIADNTNIQGNAEITGSLIVTNGITGSLLGTASYALNVLSASYAKTASYVNTLNQNVTINGGLTVNGTGSFDYLIVNVIESASVIYSTGSNQLGDSETDTQLLYGNVRIPTGSLTVTGSVFLTSSYIASPDYIDFNTTGPTVQPSVGRLSWNQQDKTLDIGTGDGDTTIQIGQETVYPLVVNKDSVDLVEGTLVMIDPNQIAQGNRIRVIRAITDGTYPSQYLVGILTEDIPINQEGFATWFGNVRNLNIPTLEANGIKPVGEAWAEGDILYPNPAVSGGLTFTPPQAPNINGTIAAITSLNGVNLTLLVRPTLTFTLTELTNVRTQNVTDGDILVKSGSLWISSKQLTGSYAITGSLTVSGSSTFTNIGPAIFSGSVTSTGGFTGSLLGTAATASYVTLAQTASYVQTAQTASYVLQAVSASFALTASSVNTLNQIVRVGNDIELNNQIGAVNANSFDAGLGNVFIDGLASSIDLNASTIVIDGVTGDITATNFIGDLTGTASYATQAISASYADTAFSALNTPFAIITASNIGNDDTIEFLKGGGGAFQVTVNNVQDAVSASYAPNTGVTKIIAGSNINISPTSGVGDVTINATAASPFPYTGSAIISGSLIVTGSLLITGSATLINEGPTILSGSFNVQGAGDGFTGPFTAITVDDANFTRTLHDSQTGTSSLDFGNRSLVDGSGNFVLSWDGLVGFINSTLYSNNTIDATTRNTLLSNFANAGQTLVDVTFDTGTVVDFDLVYLETDGIWYPVDQTTTSSTKLLGICLGYDPGTGLGAVILEGDISVSTSPGGAPVVNNANYGLPIYIDEGAGNVMDTTIPTTGYVRILGHCYYNDGANNWIMKFRPSNEWYII